MVRLGGIGSFPLVMVDDLLRECSRAPDGSRVHVGVLRRGQRVETSAILTDSLE